MASVLGVTSEHFPCVEAVASVGFPSELTLTLNVVTLHGEKNVTHLHVWQSHPIQNKT